MKPAGNQSRGRIEPAYYLVAERHVSPWTLRGKPPVLYTHAVRRLADDSLVFRTQSADDGYTLVKRLHEPVAA